MQELKLLGAFSSFHFWHYGCVSISAFASLLDIPVGITSSAATIKFCILNVGIKKYKSVIKKNGKKNYK